MGGWIRKTATTMTVVAKMGPFPREEYVVLMKDEAEKINCGSDKKFWPQRTHNSFKIDWTTRYRPEGRGAFVLVVVVVPFSTPVIVRYRPRALHLPC